MSEPPAKKVRSEDASAAPAVAPQVSAVAAVVVPATSTVVASSCSDSPPVGLVTSSAAAPPTTTLMAAAVPTGNENAMLLKALQAARKQREGLLKHIYQCHASAGFPTVSASG